MLASYLIAITGVLAFMFWDFEGPDKLRAYLYFRQLKKRIDTVAQPFGVKTKIQLLLDVSCRMKLSCSFPDGVYINLIGWAGGFNVYCSNEPEYGQKTKGFVLLLEFINSLRDSY